MTLIETWDDPTCAVCFGEWSRPAGRVVEIGANSYRVCGDCVKTGKLKQFRAMREYQAGQSGKERRRR
jgi:hypothetical protein